MKEFLEKPMSESITTSASLLENTIYDRAINHGVDQPSTVLYKREYVALMQDLAPEKQMQIAKNVSMMAHMNGHRGMILRSIATSHALSPEGKYLHELHQWSGSIAEHGGTQHFDLLLQTPLLDTKDPEATFEQVIFLEKNPDVNRGEVDKARISTIASLLGMPPETSKWVDLVDPLTRALENPAFVERLLTVVGSIPTDIYTKKVFKNIPPERVLSILQTLRSCETPAADYERAKLINHLFISKHANIFRTKGKKHVTLDTNGLFINLGKFHSHLPYGLCFPDTVTALGHDRWLTDNEIEELRVRCAEENNDRAGLTRETESQEQAFRLAHEPNLKMPIEEAILAKPELVVELCAKGVILPDSMLDQFYNSGSPKMRFALFALADKIAEHITDTVTKDGEGKEVTHPYKTLHTAETAYQIRNSIMNRPEYYNVVKIATRLLQRPIPYDDNQTGYIRGAYKVQNGEQHIFIEMLREGRVARILLNESKHLRAREKRHCNEIPLYGREEYIAAERAIAVFDRFTQVSKSVRKISLLDSSAIQQLETCLDFLLSSVTSLYPEASKHFNALTDAPAVNQQDHIHAFADICDRAAVEYQSFLYSHLLKDPSSFHEHVAPEVKKHDIHFGSATFEDMREHVAINGCDEEISTTAQPIRVVTLHYKPDDPTAAIPFHIEESAIEALRLNPERPLINVIGGCKNLERALETDPLKLMSSAVLEVAHEFRANVAVPGTQSGIGVTFGKANIDYRAHFGHLPHDEQAHLFAISPGENTYFPGNPFYSADIDRNDIYAIPPVDSILTPFGADWNATGVRKLQSRYIYHIAYMESLFQRIAERQKKIIVVGNGGFYSLLELNESFRRGFNVILIKDSGRFAEIASCAIQHPHILKLFAQGSEGDKGLIDLINHSVSSSVADEFFKKDFGFESAAENEDYQIYRDTLRTFARIIENNSDRISITSLDTLASTLREKMK
jgi:hypothetical protein